MHLRDAVGAPQHDLRRAEAVPARSPRDPQPPVGLLPVLQALFVFRTDVVRRRRDDRRTGVCTDLVRLAVTEEQVSTHHLPTAPPKPTDHRSFTPSTTTQLEAIRPDVLARIVRAAIEERRDMTVYRQVLDQEREERAWLLADLDSS
ncbi:hypothetical protein [Streptomyces sp. NPDC046909]|uniref:hypothetical protein n=1 Tax=Streptomyces sp. NPDC046909 TaxID=3155617 RepID=UPI0033DD3808